MKSRYLSSLTVILLLAVCSNQTSYAQCGAGYTQAQVNWDKLDYYFNSTSSSNKPYSTYVSDAMEQSQKFAIGPDYVTITTSSNALVNPGSSNGVSAENNIHTGDLAGYTGEDVQYNPSAAGQTITLTFNTEVANASFSLYDIDGNGAITVSAVNGLGISQNVTTSNVGSSLLISGVLSKTATETSGTNLANNLNDGSVTFTVAGPVKTITIAVSVLGTDPVFWLSDINACVTGSFPTNYNQTNTEPFTGPAGNQANYFIITPDNNSAYMVDPATGNAWFLFQDASNTYMNCFAYDPDHRYLYYVSEGWPAVSTNKTLKRYDFNTGTSTTLTTDLSSLLNIPTFDQSLEGAGAAFYNGQLYLGIEGGRYNSSNTRESIVWRIDFDGSLNPTNASQVFAINSYSGSTIIHDWADFIIKNGVLYNYNSTYGSSGPARVSYEHYDMMTGSSVQYTNPSTTAGNAGQAGMDWNGNLYNFFSTGITTYNEDGTIGGTILPINLMSGGTWPGGAGDASENFRPACDFGDAPASYDPNPVSPAVHERSDNLRLGATWDSEWLKTSSSGANADGSDEDGIATVPLLDTGTFNYLIDISVYNNSGSDATVAAWLDYNGNGVFDASEGLTTTVSSSASQQNISLVWWLINTPLTIGQSTYLRVRITSASKGMGTANATGYYDVGEVEDYQVMISSVLPVKLYGFDAKLQKDNSVKLSWDSENEENIGKYDIERSVDGISWEKRGEVTATNIKTAQQYSWTDVIALRGRSYYRIRATKRADGSTDQYSDTRTVLNGKALGINEVKPNPAYDVTNISIESDMNVSGELRLLNMQGVVLMSKMVELNEGSNVLKLQGLDKYAAGNYIVQLKAGERTYTKQVMLRGR